MASQRACSKFVGSMDYKNPQSRTLIKAYTINGWKNCLRIQDNEYSLKHLLGRCFDFEEEETMLQAMGHSLGVLVD